MKSLSLRPGSKRHDVCQFTDFNFFYKQTSTVYSKQIQGNVK